MMLFDRIYNAANELNFKSLQELCKSASIDVRKHDVTPAEQLALEGKFDIAMTLLKDYGANVNCIARGFAQGGYIDYAMTLRNKHDANVNYIAQGAAQGGHFEFAMILLKKLGASVRFIAQGAAQGGHFEFANTLFHEHGADVNAIAFGAAVGGHFEFANTLFHEHGADVNSIAQGAAKGGHFKFANTLFHEHGADVNSIAQGAASSEYFDIALKFHKDHGANVNHIALGAAEGGYFYFSMNLGASVNYSAYGAAFNGYSDYAMKLLKIYNVNVNYIVCGAACGGYFDIAMEFYENHRAHSKWITKSAIQNGYTDNSNILLNSILQIKNFENRKTIIEAFKMQYVYLSLHLINNLPKLPKKIEGIYQFKNKYDLDLQQAEFLQSCQQIRSLMILFYKPLTNSSKYCLPKEVFLQIALFFAPSLMSIENAEELLFKLQQYTLIHALKNYSTGKKGLFSFFNSEPKHKKRAESFSKAIKNTKKLDQMSKLVQQQFSLFSGIDKYNKEGKTPLIIAVLNGTISNIQSLLESYADPNKPELKTKLTPLAFAVLNKRSDIIELLLKYHARTDLQDSNGDTPYHLAVTNNCDDEVIKLLSSPSEVRVLREYEKPLENDSRDDDFYPILERSTLRF